MTAGNEGKTATKGYKYKIESRKTNAIDHKQSVHAIKDYQAS